MATVGIINNSAADSGAEVESIEKLIRLHGFNVMFVGPEVDMDSDIMRRLSAIDGLVIRGAIDVKRQKIRQDKISWAGPRNRWGSLK